MRRLAAALAASFAYFSILPVAREGPTAAPDGAELLALPVVGAVLGAFAGTAGLAAARFVPPPVAAAIAGATAIGLSGAIHLDGFLDSCDALFASVSVDRRFDILKDPHHGSFALSGLAIVANLWQASLAALPAKRFPAAFAFAGALARATVIPCAFAFPHARSGDDRPAFAAPYAALTLTGELALLVLWGRRLAPRVPLLVPASLVAAVAIEAWCAQRLGGGLVGDAYGFAIVVLEVAIFTVLAAELT